MLGSVAALLVRLYQRTIGLFFAGHCRFEPTCSEYAVEAFRVNGLLVGGGQALWRVLRCGPWSAAGVDHAPSVAWARPVRMWRARPEARHG